MLQIADHASGKNYLPTYDTNGNVTALLTAGSGALAAVYEYSPYGELLRATVNDATVADNPWQFSTKFTDAETGLVYYGHRYYSVTLGRFINRDPVEESGGVNLYGFCLNDPIDKWDVLGNAPSDRDVELPDEKKKLVKDKQGEPKPDPNSVAARSPGEAAWQKAVAEVRGSNLGLPRQASSDSADGASKNQGSNNGTTVQTSTQEKSTVPPEKSEETPKSKGSGGNAGGDLTFSDYDRAITYGISKGIHNILESIEIRIGGGVGLNASGQFGPWKASAGPKVTLVGFWFNLAGDGGGYQNFSTGAKTNVGKIEFGLSVAGESKWGRKNGKFFYSETSERAGPKWMMGPVNPTNSKTSMWKGDWGVIGGQVKFLLVDFGVKMDVLKALGLK